MVDPHHDPQINHTLFIYFHPEMTCNDDDVCNFHVCSMFGYTAAELHSFYLTLLPTAPTHTRSTSKSLDENLHFVECHLQAPSVRLCVHVVRGIATKEPMVRNVQNLIFSKCKKFNSPKYEYDFVFSLLWLLAASFIANSLMLLDENQKFVLSSMEFFQFDRLAYEA